MQLGRYVYLSITTSYNADLFAVDLIDHVHPYEYRQKFCFSSWLPFRRAVTVLRQAFFLERYLEPSLYLFGGFGETWTHAPSIKGRVLYPTKLQTRKKI